MANDNLLFRQVNPNQIYEGTPGSNAFCPGSNDDDKLSVDCSNMTSAEDAFNLHLRKTRPVAGGGRENLRSAGTWAISREICAALKLPVTHDPIGNEPFQPDNSAHHLVDFSRIQGNTKKKNRAAGKRLRDEAVERGKIWPQG